MPRLKGDSFLLEVQLLKERVASFDEYPYSLPAIRRLRRLVLHPAVTFLVGENGSGKSTLLEAIAVACGFNPEGGSRNVRFETRSSHSELHTALRVVRGVRRPRDGFFLRAESLFNLATEIERLGVLDSYGGRSLHEQSHGESFLALLTERLGAGGLYMLDEPEAALSPMRQLTAMAIIRELVRQGSQFVIATHSPILMAYPDADIVLLDERGLHKVPYTQTEHYQVTRDFLNRYRSMLRTLFGEEGESEAGDV